MQAVTIDLDVPDDTGAITYVSDNIEVATVDDTGQVTFVGLGSVTITATKAKTAKYKASTARYTLNIRELIQGDVISFEDTDVTERFVLKTYTQAVTIDPDVSDDTGAITYVSDNIEVATVDDTGQVTFVDYGSVIITATKAKTAKYKASTAYYTLNLRKMTQEELTKVNQHIRNASNHWKSRRYRQAVEEIDKSAEIYPSHAHIQYLKASYYLSYGNSLTENSNGQKEAYKVVYTELQKALAKFPNRYDYNRNFAVLLFYEINNKLPIVEAKRNRNSIYWEQRHSPQQIRQVFGGAENVNKALSDIERRLSFCDELLELFKKLKKINASRFNSDFVKGILQNPRVTRGLKQIYTLMKNKLLTAKE